MKTKTLQWRFNFLMIAYCLASCAIAGFAAIFLDSKGLTSTQIGLCTGGAGLISIPLSTAISRFMIRHPKISLQAWILSMMAACVLLYFLISAFTPPAWILMAIYIAADAFIISMYPVAVTLVMNFVSQDAKLNFGLARGSGSISYALSSIVLSRILQDFSSFWLWIFFVAAAFIMAAALWHTKASFPIPETKAVPDKKAEKKESFAAVIKAYPLFSILLVGFTLLMASFTLISTFLVRLINNLGGDTSFVGFCMFLRFCAEMPAMAIAPWLLKKTGPMPLLVVSAIFFMGRTLLPVFATQLWIIPLGMLCQGLSYGMMATVLAYYITETMLPSQAAIGQTLFNIMVAGVGATLGNLAGGVALDALGLAGMKWVVCALTFSGVAFVIVPIACRRAFEKRPAL